LSGNVVLDIGANIGDDTLVIARIIGSKGKVYAFEPDPENFKLLKKNVKANGYTNVVTVGKAVSNKNGKVKLFLSENNKADHRIYESDNSRKYVEVDTISLDKYFGHLSRKINVIKIDIQGAEMMAFEGMVKLFKDNKYPKLLTEFWPIGLKRCGSSSILFLKLIRGMKYVIYYVDEKNSKVVKVSDRYLLNKFTERNEKFANLLCVREKK
jgi:FkbM family methyltransferase